MSPRLLRQDKPGRPKSAKAWAPDRKWTHERWGALLERLLAEGIVNWKEVTVLVLGQLNPPQVGTQVASNKNVQAEYGRGKTWRAVRQWLYAETGKCARCGTRLDLQAAHKTPRQPRRGLRHVYRLENYRLLCRRCNVIERPSHKRGGITFLSAEAALMWLLLVYRPATYEEYKSLCRKYGLTMADIRFQEAWAMAEWLSREGKYP